MRIPILLLLIISLLAACHHGGNSASDKTAKDTVAGSNAAKTEEKPRFFPVTSFIRGQLFEISNKGINPLKYTTRNGHTDSVWLKLEEVESAVHEFLEPTIDSTNLISLFTEKKFLDQTLDAFTFSYDPAGALPDTMHLSRWDVYVDPKSGNVKRVYMVKNTTDNKTLQLTWLSGHWCKITTIGNKPDGSSEVEKEEKITWDF